jgi:hypothetical protein
MRVSRALPTVHIDAGGCDVVSMLTPDPGGIFKLELFLPEEYPMNPPKVRFLTKI